MPKEIIIVTMVVETDDPKRMSAITENLAYAMLRLNVEIPEVKQAAYERRQI